MLKEYTGAALDLFFPNYCLACQKHFKHYAGIENLLCWECWQDIKKNTPPFCQRCGRHLANAHLENLCANCRKHTLFFDRAFSPCLYTGITEKLIHCLKYNSQEHLADCLAGLIIDFIKDYGLPPLEYFDMFMPIPLYKSKLREREFNQAELIAAALAKNFGLALNSTTLVRVRNTQTQTQLNEGQRFANIKGCFSLRNPQAIKDKMIILVDDVLTTGATCSEAARLLKENGAQGVYVLTVAS